ncbi:MAG: FAD binding domain-containing protein [Elusimicrobiota bacterium]|nr:FAD binding domain-containing protein [Elusimicrobiota bacterium]
MLPEFNFKRPQTLIEALEIYSSGNYSIIAGGTDVIVELRKEKKAEQDILDITGLDELKGIRKEGKNIVIGALSTFSEVFSSPLIEKEAPLLKEAVRNVGSLQIRNRGTIGGNICNASPAADSVPALVALDSMLTLASPQGERKIKLDKFITWPYATDIKEEEILKSISFSPPEFTGYHFYKLGRREALAISRMNVAVMLKIKGGKIEKAFISPGSVMPSPGRVSVAEKLVEGNKPSKEIFEKAGFKVSEIMIKESGIRWSTEYKKPVIEQMVKRALIFAAGLKE